MMKSIVVTNFTTVHVTNFTTNLFEATKPFPGGVCVVKVVLHRWLDDMEVEQLVLRIVSLIWEIDQSDWETL